MESQRSLAGWIHAGDPSEVILGPSTTQLLHNLSHSMVRIFQPGDEVIVTDCDHEANIGPWRKMERYGIRIKEWKINKGSLRLELADLEQLLTEKTRLVAYTHTSNILGTINPVREIADLAHSGGAWVCIDGVAYAPHRLVDVKQTGADFYAFSFYKVYGPHYSLLFGKRSIVEQLPGINHYFIGPEEIPYKLQPGNVNFELCHSLPGVIEYLEEVYKHHFGDETGELRSRMKKVFGLFADHEEALASRLMDFLNSSKGIRIIGETTSSSDIRVPTVSFVSGRMKSSEIPVQVDKHRIGIRFGDFYARRLIEHLGLSEKDGVVRISMVHYNTAEEVDRLITALEKIL